MIKHGKNNEKYLSGTFESQYKKINAPKLQDMQFLKEVITNCIVKILRGCQLNDYKGRHLYKEEALYEYVKLIFDNDKYYKVWEHTEEGTNGWGYCDPDTHSIWYIEPYNNKVYSNDFWHLSDQERAMKMLEKERDNEVSKINAEYDERISKIKNEFVTPTQINE